MEKQLTALLVDDEAEAIASLEFLLSKHNEIKIAASTTQPETVLPLCHKIRPDILFIDIQMPGKNGIELLRDLHEHNYFPYTVFVTAYDHYALPAIKEGTFDYLLKPVDPDELAKTIHKIAREIHSHHLDNRLDGLEKLLRNHQKIRFNTRNGFLLIHPDEIFYIEADANYSEIYISKEKREVVSMNLGAVEAQLPVQFIRISRSIIINSHYLVKVSGVNKRCTLRKDAEEIQFPIPEKQMPELRRRLGE